MAPVFLPSTLLMTVGLALARPPGPLEGDLLPPPDDPHADRIFYEQPETPCSSRYLRGGAPMPEAPGLYTVWRPARSYARPEMVEVLESNLRHFADVVERDLGVRTHDLPGAGAAGGLGSALIAFLDAKLQLGIDIVIEATAFGERIRGADLVITGEGMMDWQSVFGKTPIGVAQAAKRQDIPTVAIVGALGKDRRRVLDAGIDAYFAIADGPISLEDSLTRAPGLLAEAAEQAVRTFMLGA